MLEIKEVFTDKDKKRMFRFPIDLYKDCDMYVPVLIGDEMDTFNPKKNGAYSYADSRLWLAYKDGTNLNNIISMAQLVNGIQGLGSVDDKSKFYGDFATGLILGSNNLVTQQTSKPVTNTLQTLVQGTDLTAIAAAGLAAAAQSQQAQQTQADRKSVV